MASGRKRMRPVFDSSIQDEDDTPSPKRVRTRTRAPVAGPRRGGDGKGAGGNWRRGSNSIGQGMGSSGNIGRKRKTTDSQSSSGQGSQKTAGKQEKAKTSEVEEKKSSHGNDTQEGTSKIYRYLESPARRQFNPGKEAWKNRKSEGAIEKKKKAWFVPKTPEFMKVKEEDSMIEVKKERKRRRNKIMSMRTSKGQPLMRERMKLLLEDIKASTMPV